ncbi:cystathionine beta-lyase [Bacillus horti]|uniref:cysteine-S-conjugate beta-lyase n=1 Tax=Caldalkalibacillus horti TaxID=77523 RepID=A0ABT9W0E7_9BACI|nr:cystathionine beta-lyase [Bacillus horti]MDQ0166713.1 cystathionine beta-lyase [Bacillus horti]
MAKQTYDFQTKLLHNDHKIEKYTGAVSVPIYHASTYHQWDVEQPGEYDYARSGNPTRAALEQTIAELEGGSRGFAFASGMAAITTAFFLLSKGDHVLICDDVYGGTYRMITKVLSRFGIEHSFVDMSNVDEVEASIKPNTKVLYIETPSNPLLKVTDLKAIVRLAKKYDCLTFVDNTFLTPVLQRPLELGVDVVIHSATKFISGHSDVISGLIVVKNEELAEQIYFLQNSFGAVLGVQDCWLVLRGLKTLSVRMEQSTRSAYQIAAFLEQHPLVEQVYYPGLRSHEGYSIQQQQAKSAGAVLSFSLKNKEAVKQFVERVQLPVFAVSLGAVESILSYPAQMSHAAMSPKEREKRGITDGLLRLSVGLESTEDLLRDLEQGLEGVGATYSFRLESREKQIR